MDYFLIATGILTTIIIIVWTGLRINPKAFEFPGLAQSETRFLTLPEGLPEPVERFFKTIYKERIPVVETVVITGRGRIRPFGVWLPSRFIFIHKAGKDYRHYIEATFFGIPFLKVNEGYIDGVSFFESPMGTYTNDPNTNQAANLALWAEGAWFPSLWIGDVRARWQAVDQTTAILFVPFENEIDNFIVRFDPESGLIQMMEAMRYKGRGKPSKVLWITNEVRHPGQPAVSYATWLDDGKPWAAFIPEEIRFNLDVDSTIQRRGK